MNRTSLFFRATAILVCSSMLTLALPAWAFAPKVAPAPVKSQPKASRTLGAKEMQTLKGKLGENPYVSGTQRSGVNVWGVDVATMNYVTSATDLSFEGGYGVPINVTRTYSANLADEGPFGKGWVLSCDIRTTAGGLLKGDAASDRSVPVEMKQFPFGQNTASDGFSNAERIQSTDASGRETSAKLDVDGILSGPLWDKNIYESVYEDVEAGGQMYTILSSMKVTTPEGTVYVYEKEGAFTEDMDPIPWAGTPTISATPSNILLIQTITDRHGNVTTFDYTDPGSPWGPTSDAAWMNKANGVAWQNRLTSIEMPGGRTIEFTWDYEANVFGSGKHQWRITEATDGVRTVGYAYPSHSADPTAPLTQVTSPEGKTTGYAYQAAQTSAAWQSAFDGSTWQASNLLHTITDCRGMVTTIDFAMGTPYLPGTEVALPTACAYRVVQPNGLRLYVWTPGFHWYNQDNTQSYLSDYPTNVFGEPDNTSAQFVFGPDEDSINGGGLLQIARYPSTTPVSLRVTMLHRISGNGGSVPGTLFTAWRKDYSLLTGDLTDEISYIRPALKDDLARHHGFEDYTFTDPTTVETTTTYNFLGSPLEKTITESTDSGNPKHVSYAYHGYAKYYQQKAVKDEAVRISYTDYYDRYATDGKKGQVYRVYDPKWSDGFDNYAGTGWKDAIVPSNSDKWSAQFDYDTEGRPTTVEKLKSVTSGTYNRVKTVTTYGGTGTPFWGAAATVTEDYGSGSHNGIPYLNRVTETIAYDIAGRAVTTKNAAGTYFHTTYDDDGRVQAVETSTTLNGSRATLLDYTYGSSGISNGMPTQVADLTDPNRTITQTLTYASSGGGTGQVSGVTEQWVVGTTTTTEYSAAYTYNANGERETVHYDTPNGDRYWRYQAYTPVGAPESGSRAFTELIEENSSGTDLDGMLYHFDSAGRLMYAAFACTQNTDWTGWPGSPEPQAPNYYVASVRALQTNEYDAAGRVMSVENEWQSGMSYAVNGGIGGPHYASEVAIPDGKVAYGYNPDTGLRENQSFFTNSGSNWATSAYRTEEYGYDPSLDYLTSVDYNDGLANEYRTWGYDAAGNRIADSAYSTGSWVYDNLNRMTDSPKVHGISGSGSSVCWYTNDILGNRTSRNDSTTSSDVGAARYGWDKLGRMLYAATPSGGSSDYYRADGQRIEKVANASLTWFQASRTSGQYDLNFATSGASTRYFYDGQMGFEDDYNPSGTVTKINRYGLGARGLDRIEHWDGSSTSYAYPIYDGHGNSRAMLYKSGSSYGTQNWRTYDVWGSIRSNDTTAPNPTQRYCASLGHVSEDDSGLIYMRARYHEPSTGRFISEDPGRDGWNWYSYAHSNPTNWVDEDGRQSSPLWRQIVRLIALTGGTAFLVCAYEAAFLASEARTPGELVAAYDACLTAVGVMGLAMVYSGGVVSNNLDVAFVLALAGSIFGWLSGAVAAAATGGKVGYSKIAVIMCFAYSLIIAGLLLWDVLEATIQGF